MEFKVIEEHSFVFHDDSSAVTGTGLQDYTRVCMMRSGSVRTLNSWHSCWGFWLRLYISSYSSKTKIFQSTTFA
jgi:hypothetical protein